MELFFQNFFGCMSKAHVTEHIRASCKSKDPTESSVDVFVLGRQIRLEGAVFCSLIRELVGNEFFSFYDNMIIFVLFSC